MMRQRVASGKWRRSEIRTRCGKFIKSDESDLSDSLSVDIGYSVLDIGYCLSCRLTRSRVEVASGIRHPPSAIHNPQSRDGHIAARTFFGVTRQFRIADFDDVAGFQLTHFDLFAIDECTVA